MNFWLTEIDFFDDAEPHSAPQNMAIDEALLEAAARPLLRVYRWARPAVSFGYFERWEPVRLAHPEREPVRRWTGGGVVPHGEDFTYSVLVPRRDSAARGSAADSYAAIHGALGRALNGAGISAGLAAPSCGRISQACFENPVAHDVMVDGRKVAGGAQRRTRLGLLHQGSVQGLRLPENFGLLLAAGLAEEVDAAQCHVFARARELAETKYGAREWLERVP